MSEKKPRTLTEAVEQNTRMLLERGYITPQQVKDINQSSFVMALGVVLLLPLALGVLFYLSL